MSQYLSMIPSQVMRLEQRLTPQLIQSMEILQLPLAALEARVREELQSNPVLEESERLPPAEADKPAKEELPHSEANDSEAESFERLDRLSRDLELDPGDLPFGRSGGSGGGDRDSKMDAMANTASRGEGLREQLLKQWALVETSAEIRHAGEAIIDWMDEDGYLRRESDRERGNGDADGSHATPLTFQRSDEDRTRLMEDISLSRTPPIPESVLAEALQLVQTLEPTGLGARDLTECLLIQLRGEAVEDPLVEELIENHLLDLAKNRYPNVAKATGRSIEDIQEALKVIRRLHHHPGLLVVPTDVPRVSPDIIIEYAETGDAYQVRLARGNTPRLRISPRYRQMLQAGGADKATRDFIRKRVESASAIIDAIQYRRERLLELGKVLVERQREFFDYGPQYLKVLRMRDLATEFGCDPSTISRTVDEKYVQSPRGIHPLRMFFTGGTEDASGAEISWDSVKAKVQEIIEAEDKAEPLTDDQVVEKLTAAGVNLSRRTVAKYRAQLNIPAAPQRKKF